MSATDQEDLSPERHRRRPPRFPQGPDLPSRWCLQGSDPAQPRLRSAKKVRALGLKHALSAKVAAGELVIVDNGLNIAEAKTSARRQGGRENGWKRVLAIDGAEVNENFARAARNMEGWTCCPRWCQRL